MKLAVPRSLLLTLTGMAATGLITAGFVRAATNPTTTNTTNATNSADVGDASTIDQPIASTATTAAATTTPQFDPAKGGHVGANGVREELLTGDDATKATAAAQAAVPGGTIQRLETDAEGAAYEAHMTKSDGSHVTVKMDASFKVTGTETGMGGPH